MEHSEKFEEFLDLQLQRLKQDLLSRHAQEVSNACEENQKQQESLPHHAQKAERSHLVREDGVADCSDPVRPVPSLRMNQPTSPKSECPLPPLSAPPNLVCRLESGSALHSDLRFSANASMGSSAASEFAVGSHRSLSKRTEADLNIEVLNSQFAKRKGGPSGFLPIDGNRRQEIAASKKFELHRDWQNCTEVPWDFARREFALNNRGCVGSLNPNTFAFEDGQVFVGSAIQSNSCIQRLIIHPDSRLARIIALLSGIIFACDLLLFPVTFCFQVDSVFGLQVMSWLSTIFWSIDLPCSFITGYYRKGVVEMRPSNVMCRYLKTFFLLDFVVIINDWVSIILASSDQNTGILRVSRTFKYYRFLRIVRILRLMKIFQLLKSYVDGFATELMMVVGKLFLLILGVVMISHYVACVWYALAQYTSETSTWVTIAGLEGESELYLYSASLHWSLTQLTPATNNIYPANARERLYAIFVVMSALVMFSTFLSSLTNAWREIQKLYFDQHAEESKIRQFLHARSVPLEFARQIWNFYRYHYKAPQKRIHYADLEVLRKLPKALRMCLQKHINMPVLCTNGVFLRFSKLDYDAILNVCDTCVSEVSLANQCDVFNSGDPAKSMFFLISGSVLYDCKLYKAVAFMQAQQCISEVALWALWSHCGSLTTFSPCELVRVDVGEFRTIMVRRADPKAISSLKTYAAGYIEEINKSFKGPHPITDIINPQWDEDWEVIMRRLLDEAFPVEREQEQRATLRSSFSPVATWMVGPSRWVPARFKSCEQRESTK